MPKPRTSWLVEYADRHIQPTEWEVWGEMETEQEAEEQVAKRRDLGWLARARPPEAALVDRCYAAGWSDMRAIACGMFEASGRPDLARQLRKTDMPSSGDK